MQKLKLSKLTPAALQNEVSRSNLRLRTAQKMGVFALSIISSSLVMANDIGWYAGASGGVSGANIDGPRTNQALSTSGFRSTLREDERSAAGKVYGGYQVNKNLAIEGGYFNLGKFGFHADTSPTGTLDGQIKVQGLNLDVVGILPVTEKLSAFGRVGVTYANAQDEFRTSGAVRVNNPSPSKRDVNYKFGAGLQYSVTDQLSVRGEVERYRINDAVGNRGDIDMASVGVVYYFDKPVARPVAYREPAREVVAPQPVVVAPQVPLIVAPRQIMNVNLSADSLFDFNKFTLKPAGQASLDTLARDLKGLAYTNVSIVGHTDRIGSDTYNQKLSESRAKAVKQYLVEAGIPSDKITNQGVGETQPVTTDCKGEKAHPKLVSCLSPDRRVSVHVSGTK